jgi:predicted ribosomally synthesized peptide with SipW-like signal peptide
MKEKTKRKSFLAEILVGALAIVVCLSMLTITTFAWFTDEVTSNGNRIVAGNLDLVVEVATVTPAEDESGTFSTVYSEVTDETEFFADDAQFEPGAVFSVFLRVRNNGSLALKYKLNLSFTEKSGLNQANESYKLSNFLDFVVLQETEEIIGEQVFAPFAQRPDSTDEITGGMQLGESSGTMFYIEDKLLTPVSYAETDADSSDYYTLVIYMPEEVDNAANPLEAAEISVDLFAESKQARFENDSYDNTFDDDSLYPSEIVSTPAALDNALGKKGSGVVALTEDIEPVASNRTWGYGVEVFSPNTRLSSVDGTEKVIQAKTQITSAAFELQPEAFVAGGGVESTFVGGNEGAEVDHIQYRKVTGGTVNFDMENVKIECTRIGQNYSSGLAIGWPRADAPYTYELIDNKMPANYASLESSTININGGTFETRTNAMADYAGAIKLVGVRNSTINIKGVTFIVHNTGGYDATQSNTGSRYNIVINEAARAGEDRDEGLYECRNNTFNFIDCKFIFVNDNVLRNDNPGEIDSGFEADFGPVTVIPANTANLFGNWFDGEPQALSANRLDYSIGSVADDFFSAVVINEDATETEYKFNNLFHLTQMFAGCLGSWQDIPNNINFAMGSRSVYNFGTEEFILLLSAPR